MCSNLLRPGVETAAFHCRKPLSPRNLEPRGFEPLIRHASLALGRLIRFQSRFAMVLDI